MQTHIVAEIYIKKALEFLQISAFSKQPNNPLVLMRIESDLSDPISLSDSRLPATPSRPQSRGG
jgi:hypothetical protein